MFISAGHRLNDVRYHHQPAGVRHRRQTNAFAALEQIAAVWAELVALAHLVVAAPAAVARLALAEPFAAMVAASPVLFGEFDHCPDFVGAAPADCSAFSLDWLLAGVHH